MKVNHKNLAYPLLRISLGLIFLVNGIGKLAHGPTAFADRMVQQFAGTPLPSASVWLFGMLLPFAEFGLGLLLTFGLLTLLGLSLLAVLMMALTFGMILLQQPPVVAQNLLYSVATFFLIFFYEHNAFAIDNVWFRRPRGAGFNEERPSVLERPRAA
jgi:thiosulfate dehydrogenase [quinone] large subunit